MGVTDKYLKHIIQTRDQSLLENTIDQNCLSLLLKIRQLWERIKRINRCHWQAQQTTIALADLSTVLK